MPRRSGSGRTPGSTEDRRPTPGENPQLVPRDRVTRTALKYHPTDNTATRQRSSVSAAISFATSAIGTATMSGLMAVTWKRSEGSRSSLQPLGPAQWSIVDNPVGFWRGRYSSIYPANSHRLISGRQLAHAEIIDDEQRHRCDALDVELALAGGRARREGRDTPGGSRGVSQARERGTRAGVTAGGSRPRERVEETALPCMPRKPVVRY